MHPFIYLLPASLSRKRLLKKLPVEALYEVSISKGEKIKGMLLDTFDEELFHGAKLLIETEIYLLVVDLQTGQFTQQPNEQQWSFAGDLQEGPVATLLSGVSVLRAFLPVEKVEISFEHGLLLDDEGKTRARFNNLVLWRGKKNVSVGCTQYLRGYGQAHEDLQQALIKTGAKKCAEAPTVHKSLKIKRRKYTSKPVLNLDEGGPASESARCIIDGFIRTARRNEYGVIADFDTEFLHDFRVSLRKVRSVLSLFKGAFPADDTLSLEEDFASLMQRTNRLRDLDVYLLNKQKYLRLVPKGTHDGLVLLFEYFARQRSEEQKNVSKFLQSKSYQKEIDRLLGVFGDGSSLASGPKGDENSLVFARRLVLKRYSKVCNIARNIDDQTDDKVVHKLRINCKKLRYLMEFFGPLFNQDEMISLIKSLKLLQDNLGKFNDYSVQQAFLRQVLADEMSGFGGWEVKVAEGVGALTAMLHRLQKKERRQVMKNFARFDSVETRQLVIKLFTPEEGIDENNSLLQ